MTAAAAAPRRIARDTVVRNPLRRDAVVRDTVVRGAMIALLCGCARTPTPAPAPDPMTIRSTTLPPVNLAPAKADVGALQAFVDSLVALPQFSNAHWGILVVAPERGDTLAASGADRLAMPASNQKLITGAIALATLGPDFTWRTTFTGTGPVRQGELRGDIVISGRGDPSISTAMRGDPLTAFDPLVAALRAAGVRRISGRVRSTDSTAFPGSPHGFGWDWDDLGEGYGAGVTELMFNEGFADITVRGCGAAGARACITTSPALTTPAIHADVRIVAPGTPVQRITAWRDSAATPGITMRGSIAPGDSLTLSVAQPDLRVTYAAAVVEALQRAGITVRGRAATSVRSDTLVVLTSKPLREVLPAMQKPSQNQIAEALFRTVALEVTSVGSSDSARVVFERQLVAWGARRDGFAVRDGSGLSRHDYLSPRTIMQVLDTMRRSATFALYRDALPLAGVEGTLRNRMRETAQGRVRAKTGTVDKARSLSGYVTTVDGELLQFSMLTNNHTVPNREVDRVQDLIVERLLRLRRGER